MLFAALSQCQADQAVVEHVPQMVEAEPLTLIDAHVGRGVGFRVSSEIPVDVDQGAE